MTLFSYIYSIVPYFVFALPQSPPLFFTLAGPLPPSKEFLLLLLQYTHTNTHMYIYIYIYPSLVTPYFFPYTFSFLS